MNRKDRRAQKQNKTKGINGHSSQDAAQNLPPLFQEKFNQAEKFMRENAYLRAGELFTEIMQAHPTHLPSVEQMGLCCLYLERYDVALNFFDALIQANPSRIYYYRAHKGYVYLAQERYDDAIKILEEAAVHIQDVNVHANLGKAYLFKGNVDKFLFHCKAAIHLDPHNASLFFEYMKNKDSFGPEDDQMIQMLYDVEKEVKDLSSEFQALYYYTMFSVQNKMKHYEDAFAHAVKGAQIKRKTLSYDSADFDEYFEAYTRYFSAAFYRDHKAQEVAGSERPVFVCAMPRSGTTLLEQILNSHPDITGIGEDRFLTNLITKRSDLSPYNGTPYYVWQGARRVTPFLQPHEIGAEFIAHINEKAPDTKRVVEKALGNYLYLGYIAQALPQAKFIHIKRDAVDCCLSIFTHLFADNAQVYSYDFEEIAHRYRRYVEFMQHWQSVFPERIFNVEYEDLVADARTHVEAMLSFLDLPWDDRCLEFYKQDSTVRTASLHQVRKPIYTSSVARWKRYGSAVKPLIEALGDLASDEAQAFLKE